MPIQIYWKFYHQKQKMKFSNKTFWYFSYFCSKHRLWYSLEPPRRRGSNEYPQFVFLSGNKKNNVYPCKPQFYYIKVGFEGVKIIQACFRVVVSFNSCAICIPSGCIQYLPLARLSHAGTLCLDRCNALALNSGYPRRICETGCLALKLALDPMLNFKVEFFTIALCYY